MAISNGFGLAVRTEAGGPGWGKVISIKEKSRPVLVGVLPKSKWLDTPSMLTSASSYDVFEVLWERFIENMNLEVFLEASMQFSRRFGVYPKELEFVNNLEGVIGSYAKKSVFVVVLEDWGVHDDIKHVMVEFLDKVYSFEMTTSSLKTAPMITI